MRPQVDDDVAERSERRATGEGQHENRDDDDQRVGQDEQRLSLLPRELDQRGKLLVLDDVQRLRAFGDAIRHPLQ
jgi:hypothetical protein